MAQAGKQLVAHRSKHAQLILLLFNNAIRLWEGCLSWIFDVMSTLRVAILVGDNITYEPHQLHTINQATNLQAPFSAAQVPNKAGYYVQQQEQKDRTPTVPHVLDLAVRSVTLVPRSFFPKFGSLEDCDVLSRWGEEVVGLGEKKKPKRKGIPEDT
ncbi:hypothetical protein GQ43DRAFT_430618 [Delitschia confertaspora ATCC 74209]|uniref:Uncharacterized protein n=1 Tax=Delitschia confertaspora ATCC 74209 TaxID=1513339 RepID=A0A9P4MWW5_9PLEO|nr:hypothetical protein GQ43DRAFT_430618 [Delitschia confertaspora ATCC 74209]